MSLIIRKYQDRDHQEVISLLQANCPQYFAPEEIVDFERYLKEEAEDYFVLELKGALIGAGGINYFPSEKKARLAWDFLSPKFHSQGYGQQLVEYRLNWIRKKNFPRVEVRTSQKAAGFYQKMGFSLKLVEVDFWAPGFDLHLMEKELP